MSFKNLKFIFFIYQIISSFVLLPASYFLWLREFNDNHFSALLVISIPIMFGYVIPGLGTNYLKLWKFNCGIRIGNYTLLHGLMFGGASSFLAYLCKDILINEFSFFQVLLSAHIMAVVIGFWNWLFDTYAIKYKLAIIYNKPHYEKQNAEKIVMDYAPIYFCSFGAIYGILISIFNLINLSVLNRQYLIVFIISNIGAMVLPVLFHIAFSYFKHGYFGLLPYKRNNK